MSRAGRSLSLALALLAAPLVLAACGGASDAGPSSSTAGAGHVHQAHVPAYAVATRSVSGLGTILVDGKGRTLYLFAPDRHSGISRCYHLCANQWPPFLLPKGVTKPVAVGGAEPSLLGTTRRHNGTLQVTYAGWPLYWFVYDEAPGDATGQGLDSLGGYWWVLGPTGQEITRR